MAAKVVYPYEGKPLGEGQPFPVAYAHQQRAHKARAGGDGYGGDIVQRDAGLFQRVCNYGSNLLHVAPGGQLRHHTAEPAVKRYLGINAHGDYLPRPAQDACGSFVTGAFYGQEQCIPVLLIPFKAQSGGFVVIHILYPYFALCFLASAFSMAARSREAASISPADHAAMPRAIPAKRLSGQMRIMRHTAGSMSHRSFVKNR